jgi:hypothetical protein
MTANGEGSTKWQAGINRQMIQLLHNVMMITRAGLLIFLGFNIKILQM